MRILMCVCVFVAGVWFAIDHPSKANEVKEYAEVFLAWLQQLVK